MSEIASTPATEVQRKFAFFQDEALKHPVFIATNGQPETVLLSYKEFTRLTERDRRTYGIDDLPPDLAEEILGTTVPCQLPD